MKFTLTRNRKTNKSTIGMLRKDGIFICYTLEDMDRGLTDEMPLSYIKRDKVPGHTAIPKGTYKMLLTWSNRFQQKMPILVNVKGFDGIRIHTGNTDADTEGCILVGMLEGKDRIIHSKLAYAKLLLLLNIAQSKREEVYLTII